MCCKSSLACTQPNKSSWWYCWNLWGHIPSIQRLPFLFLSQPPTYLSNLLLQEVKYQNLLSGYDLLCTLISVYFNSLLSTICSDLLSLDLLLYLPGCQFRRNIKRTVKEKKVSVYLKKRGRRYLPMSHPTKKSNKMKCASYRKVRWM